MADLTRTVTYTDPWSGEVRTYEEPILTAAEDAKQAAEERRAFGLWSADYSRQVRESDRADWLYAVGGVVS